MTNKLYSRAPVVHHLPLIATIYDLLKHLDELPQFRARKPVELPPMKLEDRFIEGFDRAQACGRYTTTNNPPIARIAISLDQSPLFKPIEKAGHIRIARDHPIGNAPAGQSLITRASQYAQNVVLRCRKIGLLQHCFKFGRERISCS